MSKWIVTFIASCAENTLLRILARSKRKRRR
jgi:hypothetical protein